MSESITATQYYIGQALQGILAHHKGEIDYEVIKNASELAVTIGNATRAAEKKAKQDAAKEGSGK